MSPRPNRGDGLGRSRRASTSRAPNSRLLDAEWRSRPYLALDFETTGLDPLRERVVEVGAIRFVPGERLLDGQEVGYRLEGAFASLVNPGMRIPSEVVAIHGIRDCDVTDSPAFSEILGALTSLAEGARIVAHNAPFDLAFLRAELVRAGFPLPDFEVLDTRLLAKAAFPGLPSYRLVDLASRLGIESGRAHRALDDAATCLALMLRCADRMPPHG